MENKIIFILYVAFLTETLIAGISTVDGKDPEFWLNHSIVYAIVKNVSPVGHGKYNITINPVATLTGGFDCGLSSNVILNLFAGESSAISTPPKTGSKTLIIIKTKEIKNVNGKKQQKYFVPSSIITFMPTKNAIVKISNIDDALVKEIMNKLIMIRTTSSKDFVAAFAINAFSNETNYTTISEYNSERISRICQEFRKLEKLERAGDISCQLKARNIVK